MLFFEADNNFRGIQFERLKLNVSVEIRVKEPPTA